MLIIFGTNSQLTGLSYVDMCSWVLLRYSHMRLSRNKHLAWSKFDPRTFINNLLPLININ